MLLEEASEKPTQHSSFRFVATFRDRWANIANLHRNRHRNLLQSMSSVRQSGKRNTFPEATIRAHYLSMSLSSSQTRGLFFLLGSLFIRNAWHTDQRTSCLEECCLRGQTVSENYCWYTSRKQIGWAEVLLFLNKFHVKVFIQEYEAGAKLKKKRLKTHRVTCHKVATSEIRGIVDSTVWP